MNIWLIGAGPHASEYAKVLTNLKVDFFVIGRGQESANKFQLSTGKAVSTEGLNNEIKHRGAPEFAIISVNYHLLSSLASTLISAGTRQILIEKPGGLNENEIYNLEKNANKFGSKVWIAYNRRFYASTIKAREMILKDGGVTSCFFELTEWSHLIEPMQLPKITKDSWMIANSSHVADLVFYLCGIPKNWTAFHSGGVSWHRNASRFCGSGVTDKGVLFSYLGDWEAPGRWAVEVLTRNRRYILKPMETLQVINLKSTSTELVTIDDALDRNFKPGLYNQTKAFLYGNTDELCSLCHQSKMINVYSKMAGY